MRHPRLRSVALALVAVLAAACTTHPGPDASRTTTISGGPTTGASGDPIPVKIAVFEDQSNEDPTQLVMPAYLGVQLALTEGASNLPVAPQLVALDVQGDPARAADLAQQVADDPAYVAAVIAPFWAETKAVGDILNAAQIPTMSLSALGPGIPSYGWTSWRRLVPTQPRQADSLAALLSAATNSVTGVCIVRDDTTYSTALAGLLKQRLGRLVTKTVTIASAPATDTFGQAVADIDGAHCRTVAWTGFAASGALLRTTLTTAGLPGVVMYGADAVKDEPFLSLTGSAGEGTVVTCPCADLATSTDPGAQRFVHDFQSQFGSSPGVYAAEGWDLGTMLLTAFRTGATSRAALVAALAGEQDVEGLAGTYAWTTSGELTAPSVQVHTFADRGQRWTPLAEAPITGPEVLPLHTEGLLTAAACRQDLPFQGEQRGRPAGFDVDLASAVAKTLGVRLGWQSVSCDQARAELAGGRLDLLFAPRDSLAQGTPSSRVVLSVRTALVTRRGATTTVLGALGPGDRVGVVSGAVTTPWAGQVLAGPGARVLRYRSGADAYDALVRGDVTAVVDTEYGAWAGIESRPKLAVAQTFDTGAHDVMITSSGTGTALLSAADDAIGHLLQSGRYALLWTKWFPGTTVPTEVGP